jgi:hypothetical protein
MRIFLLLLATQFEKGAGGEFEILQHHLTERFGKLINAEERGLRLCEGSVTSHHAWTLCLMI